MNDLTMSLLDTLDREEEGCDSLRKMYGVDTSDINSEVGQRG